MLKLGVIEESKSGWSSPIVLVPKPDGEWRFCNNYQKLNEVSKFDAYPMPRVDELIERLGHARYITTLDLTKGYWQIPMAQEAKEKTAFSTPDVCFQYVRMPFGLQGAPATFQRAMDRVLAPHKPYAAAYLDDSVIFSLDWESHLEKVQAVFDALREAGVYNKPEEMCLGQRAALTNRVIAPSDLSVSEEDVEDAAAADGGTGSSPRSTRCIIAQHTLYIAQPYVVYCEAHVVLLRSPRSMLRSPRSILRSPTKDKKIQDILACSFLDDLLELRDEELSKDSQESTGFQPFCAEGLWPIQEQNEDSSWTRSCGFPRCEDLLLEEVLIGLSSGEDGGHTMSSTHSCPQQANDSGILLLQQGSCIVMHDVDFAMDGIVLQKIYSLCHYHTTFRDPKGGHEIFDMVKPRDPYRYALTLQDLIQSSQGDTVVHYTDRS
ncbi:unnamed protein product [Ranitomeya imitator]|uniref:ribonuclease H n=1 Tax=Ranitomeya imitator TaxID=111125 RepID=A0ABN9L0D5_9NEOB|nr:unnamed protein product [Ranitomeya imitator]